MLRKVSSTNSFQARGFRRQPRTQHGTSEAKHIRLRSIAGRSPGVLGYENAAIQQVFFLFAGIHNCKPFFAPDNEAIIEFIRFIRKPQKNREKNRVCPGFSRGVQACARSRARCPPAGGAQCANTARKRAQAGKAGRHRAATARRSSPSPGRPGLTSQLMGRGIGYIDVHLLTAAAIHSARLLTRGKRLKAVAEELGLAYAADSH